VVYIYTSVSNSTLFSGYSSSLLHVSTVNVHHQITALLAEIGTLYFHYSLKN
jgi:hypothetical protein